MYMTSTNARMCFSTIADEQVVVIVESFKYPRTTVSSSLK